MAVFLFLKLVGKPGISCNLLTDLMCKFILLHYIALCLFLYISLLSCHLLHDMLLPWKSSSYASSLGNQLTENVWDIVKGCGYSDETV